jgi:hypothetical protein
MSFIRVNRYHREEYYRTIIVLFVRLHRFVQNSLCGSGIEGVQRTVAPNLSQIDRICDDKNPALEDDVPERGHVN